MKIVATDKSAELDLEIFFGSYWDDDDYYKSFELFLEGKSKNLSCKYFGEGIFPRTKDDQVTSVIAKFKDWEESLNTTNSLTLELVFTEGNETDEICVKFSFQKIDNLGHIGLAVGVSKSIRYSEVKDFYETIGFEFEIYRETAFEIINFFKTQYNESNIKNELFHN